MQLVDDPDFLLQYKLSSLEMADSLWSKHSLSQEELNYWMESYNLKDDPDCFNAYEQVYESDTANQLTKAYTEAALNEAQEDP